MNVALFVVGALLIAAGLGGAVIPLLPGIPLIFGGIWLIAAADEFRVGFGWLLGIGAIGAAGVTVDLLGAALGAKRVGASRRALWGAMAGTVIGLFFGIPGLLLGPFMGAVAGELSAGKNALRSTQVGIGTWLGLVFGAIAKLAASLMMVALFAFGWWWTHRA